ncbi:MAG TPA: hypothetical protein VGL71_10115, partial [Urbifossiella sp.]
MAQSSRNQKQIAAKYQGSLDYVRKRGRFRKVRIVCFVVAVVVSLAAAFGYRYYGPKKLNFFSTGPLSANHAQFADHCEVCHEGAQPDLVVAVERAKSTAVSDGFFTRIFAHFDPEHLSKDADEIAKQMTANTSLAKLDAACISCHEPQTLHQPQTVALGLRKVTAQIELVHASACSSCHREHEGPEKMKTPPPSNCGDCHGNQDRLLADFKLVPTGGKSMPATGKIGDELGEGVLRFFPPRPVPHIPKVFKAFWEGHPAFGYETPGARDTAKILFGHERHMRGDVKLDGRMLICADCHKPGDNGRYMQPIRYQDHCARCHSLQFDQQLPGLLIPHRDPDKVYDFLQSIASQYNNYYTQTNPGVTDFQPRQDFVREHLTDLMKHYNSSIRALELAVFINGDPPLPDRLTSKSNTAQFLPSCRKCHEGVTESPPEGSHKWVIPKTNMAERWMTRGPFTHAPHQHMDCKD